MQVKYLMRFIDWRDLTKMFCCGHFKFKGFEQSTLILCMGLQFIAGNSTLRGNSSDILL